MAHKIISSPDPTFQGFYEIFSDRVEAKMKCDHCRTHIELVLHGRTDLVDDVYIKRAIKARLLQQHHCTAIWQEKHSDQGIKKYLGDMVDKAEMFHEVKRKNVLRGIENK